MDQNAQQNAQPQGMDSAKTVAIVGYLVPFLFFLPMVMEELKNNEYAKFHANQQLNLLLFGVVGYVAASVLTVVLIGLLLYPVVMIGSIVFAIMGVLNAMNGQMKPLPLIGQFKLLK